MHFPVCLLGGLDLVEIESTEVAWVGYVNDLFSLFLPILPTLIVSLLISHIVEETVILDS